jgi:hypothetical protein
VSARSLKPCGTAAAYWRHLRHREPVDDACAAAFRRYCTTRSRRRRALAPIGQCGGCHRERPLFEHGWCASCITRWHRVGKPAGGPPPLPTPEQLQEIRCRNAQQGRLSLMLNQAIRRGGWEWAA